MKSKLRKRKYWVVDIYSDDFHFDYLVVLEEVAERRLHPVRALAITKEGKVEEGFTNWFSLNKFCHPCPPGLRNKIKSLAIVGQL